MKNEYHHNKRGSTSLIIFVRFPHLGRVKSRLAISLGVETATGFYRRCVEHILGESSKVLGEVQRYVFYSDRSDESEIGKWLGQRFHCLPQVAGGLGKRIEHAFRSVFKEGTQKAVILASDVPDLSARIIDDAIKALDRYDIVIGPCYDGGYYLLGMKKLHRELLGGVSWSTEHVYQQTLYNINRSKLSVYCLPFLADIDTERDLRNWIRTATDSLHPTLQYLKTTGFQTEP
ncbi:MAG: TIGR04282 family arsenosugar biosynthesis glycosyltransferase [Anaerolineales bacterium]|nr:TIGR04282 family arsenosugar biosynthesis glycosyltransferase [Anaerolineales bacterium]